MAYCEFVSGLSADNPHVFYHNHVYGFPLTGDNELFGRLLLEINQAGLSWDTILKKESNFRKAYLEFNIHKIAAFKDSDIRRLLNDSGIIRNRLKIEAAIHNAKVIVSLQSTHGSFAEWLWIHRNNRLEDWVKLFKKNFKFTGGEIVNEFLMSIGFLPGAHHENCVVFKEISKANPVWIQLINDGV
ncbi:MAG: DNA-3-methyladenine glycosylase I [Bacteroidia bacterium]